MTEVDINVVIAAINKSCKVYSIADTTTEELSDIIYTRLTGNGISARIIQYDFNNTPFYSVQYYKKSEWVNFDYTGLDMFFQPVYSRTLNPTNIVKEEMVDIQYATPDPVEDPDPIDVTIPITRSDLDGGDIYPIHETDLDSELQGKIDTPAGPTQSQVDIGVTDYIRDYSSAFQAFVAAGVTQTMINAAITQSMVNTAVTQTLVNNGVSTWIINNATAFNSQIATAANAYLAANASTFRGLGYSGLTSATSLAIGLTSKVFTVNQAQGSNAYVIGDRVRVVANGTPTAFMEGYISNYSSTTLTLTVDYIGGSGTYSSWLFSIAGVVGPNGIAGSNGTNGTNGLGYSGLTSSTSGTPSVGSTVFTVNQAQGTNAFTVGDRVRVYLTSTPTHFVEGLITAYSSTSMTVNIDTVVGAPTGSAWTITITGQVGATGATGSASDISLYKYAPATISSFTFDSTHGIASTLNQNQKYRIKGVFKTAAVSATPQLYLKFNGDGGSNYSVYIQPMNGTTYITPTQALVPNLTCTTGFPNANITLYYEIEVISLTSDYTFVEVKVTARNGSGSGSIWKFFTSGTWQSSAAITSIQVAMTSVTTPATNSNYAELSTSSALTY